MYIEGAETRPAK